MRRKISLYIGGLRADLDDQTFILFNYTMDDMGNPTVVKNSYSQQVTLPGTPDNNRIFGGMWRSDRKTGGGGSGIGIDFNASQKTPFKVYSDTSEILEAGYCRLDRVERTRNGVKYVVTLFGGLGSLLYHLMYKSDGTKKSLADLNYRIGGEVVRPEGTPFPINKGVVSDAWDALEDADDGTIYHQFNFAPAYNGLPSCKFSADRAVYHPGSGTSVCPNLYTTATEGTGADEVTYTTMAGAAGNILLEMAGSHTEWEMQDLRSYLQRPVISVKWLLTTISYYNNSGQYALVLDPEFFNDGNPWFNGSWMTLPVLNRDRVSPSSCLLSDILSGTDSPADYLIGFAKMFGLVFVTDPATRTVTLTGRNTFYGDGTVTDISRRVSVDSGILPITMESRWYIFQDDVYGLFADEYRQKYGKTYGAQWVNTGYDFDAGEVDLLDICYRGAADALEASGLYQVFGGTADTETGSFVNYLFKVPFFEDVSWRLYHADTEETSEKECRAVNTYTAGAPMRYSMDSSYNDFFVKVQLHGRDNSPEEGSNVLLFYDGPVEMPTDIQGGIAIEEVKFHLSDDSQEMLLLNDGVPCWEVAPSGDNILDLAAIPQFRRWRFDEYGDLEETWDFGDPVALAHRDPLETGRGIYSQFWAAYIADRYDVDTRAVTCRVNLEGFQVGQELLRRFWWFDGCVWVINRIINYSLTTYDDVECEFVKVQDKDNYMIGQNY